MLALPVDTSICITFPFAEGGFLPGAYRTPSALLLPPVRDTECHQHARMFRQSQNGSLRMSCLEFPFCFHPQRASPSPCPAVQPSAGEFAHSELETRDAPPHPRNIVAFSRLPSPPFAPTLHQLAVSQRNQKPHNTMKTSPLFIVVGGPDNEIWLNAKEYSLPMSYDNATQMMQLLTAQALDEESGLAFELIEA